MTNHLIKLLRDHKIADFSTSAEKEVARDIKEKVCYTAVDFDAESAKGGFEKSYELPDGLTIKLGHE